MDIKKIYQNLTEIELKIETQADLTEKSCRAEVPCWRTTKQQSPHA